MQYENNDSDNTTIIMNLKAILTLPATAKQGHNNNSKNINHTKDVRNIKHQHVKGSIMNTTEKKIIIMAYASNAVIARRKK